MSDYGPKEFSSTVLSLTVVFCSLSMMAAEGADPPNIATQSAAPIWSGDSLTIECGKFAVTLDRTGAFQTIRFRKQVFEPPEHRAAFELNGKIAHVDTCLKNDLALFKISSDSTAGVLGMSCRGTDLSLHLDFPSEKPSSATPSTLPATSVKQAGLVLTFPLDTVFHLA